MKTWKIVLVVALATVAIGLVTTSALAFVAQPTTAQYGTYNGVAASNGGYAGGIMRGGMMGNGYSSYNGIAYGANDYGRCMSTRGYP